MICFCHLLFLTCTTIAAHITKLLHPSPFDTLWHVLIYQVMTCTVIWNSEMCSPVPQITYYSVSFYSKGVVFSCKPKYVKLFTSTPKELIHLVKFLNHSKLSRLKHCCLHSVHTEFNCICLPSINGGLIM